MAQMIQEALQESGKPHTENSWKQYKLHYQRAWVQVGASLIMWLFALAAYALDLIAHRHFFGVSLVVLYLIAINPSKLWILKRILRWEHLVSFLLFINFLEIIGYTAVIYFMGGIEATYLTVLYATAIASVGSVSKREHTFLVAGICIVAYNAMILLEGASLIPWYKVIPDFHLPWSHRLARMFVVDGLLLVVAYITSYTAILLRKAKEDLQAAYGVLEQRVAERTKELSKANEELQSYIVERKKAEESIRASHEMFLTVLNSIDATIYVADIETYEIIFMNKNMIETFGKDLTGEKCWKVFRGGSEPCHDCTNEKLIDENGEPVGVVTWQGKNQVIEKWYTNFDRAIEWTDGRLVRLEIATDITELKKMEKELQQSRKMESIGTLAGGIAHDFNNLLHIIIGNTELALKKIPDFNPAHSNLEKIRSVSLRAAGIVKQLLNFSRQTDQELKPIGIVTVVNDALRFLRSMIPTTIEIRKHLPTCEITILANPVQINQVLMNIFTNAAQAMENTGGIFEINVTPVTLDEKTKCDYPDLSAGDYIKITLNDTGPGIPHNIIDRIFDPYFTTKEIGKGSGMGLAVVHGIIKNHNGIIAVDSKPGKGATFTILFPVVDEKPLIEIKAPDISSYGKETILFVDDEEAITEMAQQLLTKLGYVVETSLNPTEALKIFQSKPDKFDLILTDMTMPKMTGVEFSEKAKKIRSNIPIIICTGHSSLLDEETAKQIGIDGYLAKPVSMSEMSKTIQKVLNK